MNVPSLQSLLALSAVGLAGFHFLRGALRDLRQPGGNACGKCSAGGCPVARKG